MSVVAKAGPRVPTSVVRKKNTNSQSALGEGLFIAWSDGTSTEFTSEFLRTHCPCASCQEKRGDTTHQKPLIGKRTSLTILKATKEEETDLQKVWPVGNYAIGILWGDKHDSGIYSYQFLSTLAEQLVND